MKSQYDIRFGAYNFDNVLQVVRGVSDLCLSFIFVVCRKVDGCRFALVKRDLGNHKNLVELPALGINFLSAFGLPFCCCHWNGINWLATHLDGLLFRESRYHRLR